MVVGGWFFTNSYDNGGSYYHMMLIDIQLKIVASCTKFDPNGCKNISAYTKYMVHQSREPLVFKNLEELKYGLIPRIGLLHEYLMDKYLRQELMG